MGDIRKLLDRMDTAFMRASNLMKMPVTTESNDHQIMLFYSSVLKDQLESNSAIAGRVLDFTQLLNKKDHYEEFQLEEIALHWRKIISLEPYNLEYHESLALFYDVVLDQASEAKRVLEEGIQRIEEKLENCKELLKSIG